jgi:hypothetical protein
MDGTAEEVAACIRDQRRSGRTASSVVSAAGARPLGRPGRWGGPATWEDGAGAAGAGGRRRPDRAKQRPTGAVGPPGGGLGEGPAAAKRINGRSRKIKACLAFFPGRFLD